jgi:hypothetical protein
VTDRSYALRLGELIGQVQQYQQSPVFFLAECKVTKNDQHAALEEEDLELVKKAYGVAWSVDLDSNYCSPVHRKCTFLTNIPVAKVESDYLRGGDRHGANSVESNVMGYPSRYVEKPGRSSCRCTMPSKSYACSYNACVQLRSFLPGFTEMGSEIHLYLNRTGSLCCQCNTMTLVGSHFASRCVDPLQN